MPRVDGKGVSLGNVNICRGNCGLTPFEQLPMPRAERHRRLVSTITVLATCQFYRFAFYVIEHYFEPSYRFAGLLDSARYAIKRH